MAERRAHGRELTNAEREQEQRRLNDRRDIIDRRRAEIRHALHA